MRVYVVADNAENHTANDVIQYLHERQSLPVENFVIRRLTPRL
jgi:hypothetical protein